jgi:DNA-directed RNA polymerase specialized sigma24 family protein
VLRHAGRLSGVSLDFSDERDLSSWRTPLEAVINEELRQAVSRCLDQLQQRDSTAADVLRRGMSGESYEDISTAIGVQTPRAHRVMFTARQHMKECLDGRGR